MQYFFLHQYFQELLIRRVNDNSHQGSNEICLVKKKNLIHFFYRSDPQVSNQTSAVCFKSDLFSCLYFL